MSYLFLLSAFGELKCSLYPTEDGGNVAETLVPHFLTGTLRGACSWADAHVGELLRI